jgi:hypothetical protein
VATLDFHADMHVNYTIMAKYRDTYVQVRRALSNFGSGL